MRYWGRVIAAVAVADAVRVRNQGKASAAEGPFHCERSLGCSAQHGLASDTPAADAAAYRRQQAALARALFQMQRLRILNRIDHE